MGDVTREQALEAALKLAANRLRMTAIEAVPGTRQFYERGEWADEADAALAMPPAPGVEFTREQALEAALREAERFIDDEHPEWHLILSVDQVLKVIRTAITMTPARGVDVAVKMICLPHPMQEFAVCAGGRWDGWLFWRHPDGQWVSREKLKTAPPAPEASHDR